MTISGLVPRRSRLACSWSMSFVRARVCSSFEMFLISASIAASSRSRCADTLSSSIPLKKLCGDGAELSSIRSA